MLITLAGPDGAGKSTQTKMLHDWYVQQGYTVKILDKWDILHHETHPECRFIGGTLDDLRLCISEMKGESRALFLFWTIFQTLSDIHDLHSPKKIYISDGYWIKHAASEVLYGNDERWIRAVTAAFPTSDYLFYFDIPSAITAQRKQSFTPYECGRHKERQPEQFIKHQQALKNVMDSWSKKECWLTIDASHDANTVFTALLSHLTKEWQHA